MFVSVLRSTYLGCCLLIHTLGHVAALNIPQTSNDSLSATGALSHDKPKCFDSVESPHKTSINGCKPMFRYMKEYFPDFRLEQEFLERVRPKKPDTPPIQLSVPQGDCSIEISSHEEPLVSDRFSWEDIKNLAQEILEECKEPDGAGTGGEAHIGSKGVWKVTVKGWRIPSLGLPDTDAGASGDVVVLSGAGLADNGTIAGITFQRRWVP